MLAYLHVGDVTRQLKYEYKRVLAYLHVGDVTQRLKYEYKHVLAYLHVGDVEEVGQVEVGGEQGEGVDGTMHVGLADHVLGQLVIVVLVAWAGPPAVGCVQHLLQSLHNDRQG